MNDGALLAAAGNEDHALGGNKSLSDVLSPLSTLLMATENGEKKSEDIAFLDDLIAPKLNKHDDARRNKQYSKILQLKKRMPSFLLRMKNIKKKQRSMRPRRKALSPLPDSEESPTDDDLVLGPLQLAISSDFASETNPDDTPSEAMTTYEAPG